MSFEQFGQVMEELSAMCGFPNPLLEDALCDIQVDGINFTLLHSESDDDNLTSACDFGEVPQALSAEILRRVLETNMIFFRGDLPRFAINPQTGRVILMASIPLENLTAETLVDILKQHASFAQEWRLTYFLGYESADVIAMQMAQMEHIARLDKLDAEARALALASAA